MKYLIAAIAVFFMSSVSAGEVNILKYQFNKNVVIAISNLECPLKQFKQQYPLATVASRVDGQRLVGCYKKLNENEIIIQWQDVGNLKGDTTTLPANAFLNKQQFDENFQGEM